VTVAKERIPPGQKVTKRFPRLDIGVVLRFDASKWRLRIEGSVEKPMVLTWTEAMALPRVKVTADFHCVTGWTKLDNGWEGIPFKAVADAAKVRPEARFVGIECGDGYTTSLPLADLLKDNVLLAFSQDGANLTAEHGGPLRLIVPDKYGYKSAKWIQRIVFLVENEPGYWEKRGYSDTADPWTEDRYS